MRLTFNDADLLCNEYSVAKGQNKGDCFGCKLSEMLNLPVAKRPKTVMVRLEAKVRAVRKRHAPVV